MDTKGVDFYMRHRRKITDSLSIDVHLKVEDTLEKKLNSKFFISEFHLTVGLEEYQPL